MKILHYFLGFPPYRTGGLTKFAFDLMTSQQENGDEVFALWPGMIDPIIKKIRIRKRKNIKKIKNYEIINPLPVPLDEGIIDVSKFTAHSDVNIFITFFKDVRPDVIHVHTLMGLHREIIEAANLLSIKTVFTTHDYFGLCPKVTLFRNGKACDFDNGCAYCVNCNKSGLSYKKIMMLQSPLYRILKDSIIVKKMRKKHRANYFENDIYESSKEIVDNSQVNSYVELRKYYIDILSKIDLIHFNSTVAEKVYKRYFIPKKSILLSISNKEIKNNNYIKKVSSDKYRLTYLSAAKDYKGYGIIKEALDRLWESGNHNFVLNLYCPVLEHMPYMNIRENGFKRNELGEIFANTDILLAPSIWYETFGFTVLEALSFGVPVIVSDNVGAKDVIGDCGTVVAAGSINDLLAAITTFEEKKVDFTQLQIKEWSAFSEENKKLYLEVI